MIDIPSSNHFPSSTQLVPFNDATSKVAGSGFRAVDIPAVIPQQERLFTARSRAINHLDTRGQKTYIKLLTTDKSRSMERHGEGHDAKPTSLGTSGGGVLNDAINGGADSGYASFLLTDMRCNLEEKLQVVEVFGDAEVSYYFGRQPIMMDFSGLLVDSPDNNWFIQWVEMYAHVLRGTQLARNYELVKIVLPNMTVVGTITGMSWSQNSARDVDIPFQFRFLAKQIIPTPVKIPGKPLTNDPVINWDKAKGFLDQKGINVKKIQTAADRAQDIRNAIADPFSTTKDYAAALYNDADYAGGLIPTYGSLPSADGIAGGEGEDIGLGIPDLGQNTLGIGDKISGALNSASGAIGGSIKSAGDLFGGLTANLSGVRASLFSPIYGVLSSLTKLIKNVGGAIGSVVNGFLSPVRDILRDVRNISNEAIGIVNLINNEINGVTNQFNNLNSDILSTVTLLKKTAGVINTAPETIGASIGRLVSAGKLPTTAGFLTSRDFKKLPNGTQTKSKMALLSSGKKHTPEQGAKL